MILSDSLGGVFGLISAASVHMIDASALTRQESASIPFGSGNPKSSKTRLVNMGNRLCSIRESKVVPTDANTLRIRSSSTSVFLTLPSVSSSHWDLGWFIHSLMCADSNGLISGNTSDGICMPYLESASCKLISMTSSASISKTLKYVIFSRLTGR